MPLKWNCGSTVFALDVHPSRVQIATKLTSVLYEGFQQFSGHNISLLRPRQVIDFGNWLKVVWNLDWALGISCTSVSGCVGVKVEPCGSVERFLSWFVFHSPCVFWTPDNTAYSICETDLLRLLLWDLTSFYILFGWLVLPLVLRSRFGTFFVHINHHWKYKNKKKQK